MKLIFYFDIFPWTTGINDIWPSQIPTYPKQVDAVRYKIETEVPDPRQPDKTISVDSIVV